MRRERREEEKKRKKKKKKKKEEKKIYSISCNPYLVLRLSSIGLVVVCKSY